ncbi:SDR family NAD(P)-dependent oxidoreductase [Prochlorococcus marinus]|uniref:SDR family NAD(P)-dependent oxidoreductase n=1 Tax=Prochlorococcus marinus TaxID=1219 RepID=UPI001ADB43A0|nr:SDR family NAD(P)-dependent oxidoreductase [Prochlorococcus marinus]MBO8204973.1 SDR family oxidoreductase [Prochlorococcus marinus CUG1415]MBW3044246.1 hypothetical protein [Prochlorococcus marinus str. MU1415]
MESLKFVSSEEFSEFSCDKNPIHLENNKEGLYKDKIQFGANIILSLFEKIINKDTKISSVECTFKDKVPHDSELVINKFNNFISLTLDKVEMVSINFEVKHIDYSFIHSKNKNFDFDKSLERLTSDQILKLQNIPKEYYYNLDIAKSKLLFPKLTISNFNLIKDICFFSFLVGMKIPGERSLLSSIKYKSDSNKISDKYIVLLNKYREIASFGELKISSVHSESKVNFFLRPSINKDKEASEKFIKHSNFNKYKGLKLKAIVIGASQGIGLDLSTRLSSYGLNVTATYRTCNQQLREREKILNSQNQNFKIIQYESFKRSSIRFNHFDIIVDCTTPEIMRGKKNKIDLNLFNDFSKKYIRHLILITNKIKGFKKRFLIIIPSSTAIEDIPLGMVEYAASKSALEIIVNGLMKIYKNIVILTPRLGRVKTKQTISIIQKGISSEKAAEQITKLIIEKISKKFFTNN